MQFLHGFLWLIAFWLIGSLLVQLGHLPLSPGVIGLVLLTLYFVARGRVHSTIASASQPLIMMLAMLIMPGVVGVFQVLDQISEYWLAVLMSLVLGTLLSVASTLWLIRRLLSHTTPPHHETLLQDNALLHDEMPLQADDASRTNGQEERP
uniref:CidA/LrgA family protein n=1 Tax=Halomonas sp. TaxID=1486246 RepID=UPI00345B3637